MQPTSVDVVLARPARPANVAAACRAMKNMGLRSLWLVGAPAGLESPEVRAVAYGAWDVLDGAVRVSSLEEAVAQSTLVVGTSGRPAADAWTPRRLAQEGPARAGSGRTAIVFGPESTGLSREELDLCHLRVHIPTDPAHPSLNLAQAVLILAYEIHLASVNPSPPLEEPQARTGEVEAALEALGRGLVGVGYLNPRNPEAILAEIRRLVVRARPTPREVSLLRGMARQILWAASRVAPYAGPGG